MSFLENYSSQSQWVPTRGVPSPQEGSPELDQGSRTPLDFKGVRILTLNLSVKIPLDNNLLRSEQSGFGSGHSTLTASSLVSNDIVEALDKKMHCATLFIDLSKAFDTVDCLI